MVVMYDIDVYCNLSESFLREWWEWNGRVMYRVLLLKVMKFYFCLHKLIDTMIITECFRNRDTTGKKEISHVKVSEKYRIKLFHVKLRFRENWVWILDK